MLTALVKAGDQAWPAGFFDEHSVVIAQCARALADTGWSPGTCRHSDRRPTGSPT